MQAYYPIVSILRENFLIQYHEHFHECDFSELVQPIDRIPAFLFFPASIIQYLIYSKKPYLNPPSPLYNYKERGSYHNQCQELLYFDDKDHNYSSHFHDLIPHQCFKWQLLLDCSDD